MNGWDEGRMKNIREKTGEDIDIPFGLMERKWKEKKL
jgi:hypothetical protein